VNWPKISAFLIKYWREIFVVVSMSLVVLKTQMDYRALNKAYETSRQEMELQINSLRDIHAEEIRQRQEALESYRNALEKIQQNYLESQVALEEQRKETTDRYVEQFSQDKEALSNEIIDAYGFKLVE